MTARRIMTSSPRKKNFSPLSPRSAGLRKREPIEALIPRGHQIPNDLIDLRNGHREGRHPGKEGQQTRRP